jgi:hypothetical protein
MKYLTIPEVAALPQLKTQGKPVHVSSVWRWMCRGLSGVRLRSLVIANRRMTTTEWVDQFLDASTAAKDARLASGSPAAEAEDSDAVDAELAAELT